MEDGFTLEALAHEAGMTPSAVRGYIKRGLLAAPEFRSKNTRYGQDYLVRLRAILALRATGMNLTLVKRKLAESTREALLVLARMDRAPDSPATPAPAATPATTAPGVRAVPDGMFGPYRPALARASERWEHVALCPGVVLMVRGEADAEAWRVASEIVAVFGGRGDGAT